MVELDLNNKEKVEDIKTEIKEVKKEINNTTDLNKIARLEKKLEDLELTVNKINMAWSGFQETIKKEQEQKDLNKSIRNKKMIEDW